MSAHNLCFEQKYEKYQNFYLISPQKHHYEKHIYSNILKISPPKTKFLDKNFDIFHISAQNIDTLGLKKCLIWSYVYTLHGWVKF